MATQFWGQLSSVNTDIVTIDNISIVDIMYDMDMDFQFYTEANQQFFEMLMVSTDVPSMLIKYYDAGVQNYSEGGRPENELTQYDFTQEVSFQEKFAQLTITERGARLMAADQLAAIVQAKLTGFMDSKYQALRRTIFRNTSTTAIDTIGKYQTVTLPFYNGTLADVWPVAGYTFVAADAQHYNPLATPNTLTATEIRTKLIDKVRHHGFKQIEIWVNDFEYDFENVLGPDGRTLLIPAANQVGRNSDIAPGPDNSPRARSLSPWEGLVGYINNSPVIKTKVVPPGYACAVGVDGGPGMSPFVRRTHPVPNMEGLQIQVRSERFPLENTVMLEGFGYAPYHRGAVAVLDLRNAAYTIPAGL